MYDEEGERGQEKLYDGVHCRSEEGGGKIRTLWLQVAISSLLTGARSTRHQSAGSNRRRVPRSLISVIFLPFASAQYPVCCSSSILFDWATWLGLFMSLVAHPIGASKQCNYPNLDLPLTCYYELKLRGRSHVPFKLKLTRSHNWKDANQRSIAYIC